ncbi:hypothetical protein [Rhodoligotrophos appendicifer]|nr:hypothetical protein [Rhodoligotrophos appendicifer]
MLGTVLLFEEGRIDAVAGYVAVSVVLQSWRLSSLVRANN